MRKISALLAIIFGLLLLSGTSIHAQEATATSDAGWPVEEQCKDSAVDTRPDAIAFVSSQEVSQQIYTMNVNGNHRQAISALVDSHVSDLDWSPDGKQLAFTNNYHIYRLNIELEAATQLTANRREDYHPAWSPDGRYIAYLSSRGEYQDIWLMKPNGTNIRQLTYDPPLEITIRWSPDGDGFGYVPNSGANLQIFIENKAGTTIFMRQSADGAAYSVTDFRWSPNGQHFSLQTGFGAYIVNSDETNLRQVADRNSYVYDGAPSWSPDSCHLIYGLNEDAKPNIYIMDLYDGIIHKIAEGRDPVWKP